MTPLGAGLDYVDLEFLGMSGIIATGVLHGAAGAALIDPGPSTTVATLQRALEDRGLAMADVRAVLVTHIHLDHSGAAGLVADLCPQATFYVHERGAPHLADPTRLVASASRLYGADMDRLWGEVRPVPADRIRALSGGHPGGAGSRPEPDRLTVVGHDVEVIWTPGHAWHHVSYFLPSARIAFVGDTAGICRRSGRLVVPATPPPDIDLDVWRTSTAAILAWRPETLFLTHFGPQPAPAVHFQDMWTRMEDWSRRVEAGLARPGTDADRAAAFTAEVMDELARATSRAEAEAYSNAGRFDFSWAGLARYGRKRNAS
jgi:glyoxylase-like metal-dependent hydrolase (beta-lactamase superfamily II)